MTNRPQSRPLWIRCVLTTALGVTAALAVSGSARAELDFEAPIFPLGTLYAAPCGTGAVRFTVGGIAATVEEYLPAAGPPLCGHAEIIASGSDQNLNFENVGLRFDFTPAREPIRRVTFSFVDRGGNENFELNRLGPEVVRSAADLVTRFGADPKYAGFTATGRVLMPTVPGRISGQLEIQADPGKAITSIRIGGQEFEIDNLGDGVADSADNCPDWMNSEQLDENGDGIGDACQELVFSLDIGSDAEVSDTHGVVLGSFDPGDVYAASGIPGASLLPPSLDDADIFGADARPFGPMAASAPFEEFFDLDGLDSLEVSLSELGVNGQVLTSPILKEDSGSLRCIQTWSGALILSFHDDDDARSWKEVAGLPTDSPPDYSHELFVARAGPTGWDVTPFMTESEVHADLEPTPGTSLVDDDVDAIDLASAQCDHRYFSADDEAHLGLRPGSIYEVIPGGAPVERITAEMLGLASLDDVDAFEFGWAALPTGELALGVFFSVGAGGSVDPAGVYLSFLDGRFSADPVISRTDFSESTFGNDYQGVADPKHPGWPGVDAIMLAGCGDRDGDGFSDCEDVCPDWPDSQVDSDGNGIGDECECGDCNGDGTISVSDLVAMNVVIFGGRPYSPLCDTDENGSCTVADMVAVQLRIFGGFPLYCDRYPRP